MSFKIFSRNQIHYFKFYLQNTKLAAPSLQISTKMSGTLHTVPRVDIDKSGVFKYILLKVYDQEVDGVTPSIVILRGYKKCNYHSDIYDEVQGKLLTFDCDPLGGGRISHDPDSKKIHIYGYSQAYGKGDHEEAAKLIKSAYPDYTITVSDEGY